MTETVFEAALTARTAEMLAACTRCGKCVEVCPMAKPAGIGNAAPESVITGVLDIVQTGEGPATSKAWAKGCALTGDCIAACGDGVNPRLLLAMARVAMAKHTSELRNRRKQGVEYFRMVADGVNVLARMQLSEADLSRLGQHVNARLENGSTAKPGERPDFVFYTGCNVLKTPHMALTALDIMDMLGVTYKVMGGPTHCCGVIQLRAGDIEISGRVATGSLDKLAEGKTGVISWCASCHVQFTETTIPTIEKVRGSRPFEMTPFMLFLKTRFEDLRSMLKNRVDMRIALHKHPGVKGVVEAGTELLRMVPGIEIVDLHQPAVGLMSNSLNALPDYKRSLQLAELEAAEAASVDALVAIYHVDHRELCAHERDWPFRIINILDIVGASMGLAHDDHFKRLKIMQDADAIVADCMDMLAAYRIDPAVAREVVVKAMLNEQPLPLVGRRVDEAGRAAYMPRS
ncbi:MAG TPA: (Fe-S)-binding protein [Pseudolabrys sp.]|jgi:Fe-S oxidoreductase|nr:(Fe-S)-binding protein [Pseudolabrys sp.]